MKIELTIQQDYVPNWGLFEALRELIQNGLDAEREGHKFRARFSAKNSRLTLINDGVELTPRTLLLGYSDKRDRPEMIGQYGEGYKLALLTLVKRGYKVSIRTGSSKWTPFIAKSKKFGEKVLFIDIKNGMKDKNATEVIVEGIEKEDWSKDVRPKFLRFEKPSTLLEGKGRMGEVLVGRKYKGHMYVGGIYVQADHRLNYGYDFSPHIVTLDRDRKVVSNWDMEHATSEIWKEAIKEDPDLVEIVDQMLRENTADVWGLRYVWNVEEELRNQICAKFAKDFGPNSLPVKHSEEVGKASFYGKKGVVVGEALFELLKDDRGTLETVAEDMKNAVKEDVNIERLTGDESKNLLHAVSIVSSARPVTLADIGIAEFLDDRLQGTCEGEKIRLSRHILDDFRLTLKTLVHETAHARSRSSDGSSDFVGELEEVWSEILLNTLEGKGFAL